MAQSGRSYANQPIVLHGPASLEQTITLTGIASAETFGTTLVALDQTVTLTGIASEEGFGTSRLDLNLSLTGIASEEAFGTANLNLNLGLTGIPSEEAFGSLTIPTHYVLRPDSVQETPVAMDRLHIRYGIHRGISIIQRQDDTFYETRYPAQTELEESQRFYLGGYIHLITDAEAAALIAAGFGDLIAQEPD
jgi:hypothetical protein